MSSACGHALCQECQESLLESQCPYCRAKVDKWYRAFAMEQMVAEMGRVSSGKRKRVSEEQDVEPIADDYFCRLCRKILLDPQVSSGCKNTEHVFCSVCVFAFEVVSFNRKVCPLCERDQKNEQKGGTSARIWTSDGERVDVMASLPNVQAEVAKRQRLEGWAASVEGIIRKLKEVCNVESCEGKFTNSSGQVTEAAHPILTTLLAFVRAHASSGDIMAQMVHKINLQDPDLEDWYFLFLGVGSEWNLPQHTLVIKFVDGTEFRMW